MNEELDAGVSSLSRTVRCEGQELHIDIYEDGEGQWLLAVTNQNGVTTHWFDPFSTEQLALGAAMKAIREEGLAGFGMEQPYGNSFH